MCKMLVLSIYFIPGRPDYLAHSGGHGCQCNTNGDASKPQLVWQEQSETGSSVIPFNPRSLCNLLGGRRLLLIGDSTIEQAASTLMNALVPAGCQGQVWFAPGDTLIHKKLGVRLI